ncbi:hypothetical protein EV197_0305 [Aquimarina brevivitae]|uniref:Attachment p12 family protein n=1 Tax=Aquimarina brevivitae TaxID=323412 RepID=A0A4Q7PF73_9FLAO|nr:hypothetical protein EV197_0305 [Aquimarina brevivitae]
MEYVFQHILVLVAFILAIGYIFKKFFWKSIVKSGDDTTLCGKDDCGCH